MIKSVSQPDMRKNGEDVRHGQNEVESRSSTHKY